MKIYIRDETKLSHKVRKGLCVGKVYAKYDSPEHSDAHPPLFNKISDYTILPS